jgi:hypothetical protein
MGHSILQQSRAAQLQNTLKINPVGNLGNQMFQLMLAHSLAEHIPNLTIVGYDMPEWGLTAPVIPIQFRGSLNLKGQYVHFDALVAVFKRQWVKAIEMSALGFRMAHYLPRRYYQDLFRSQTLCPIVKLPDDALLINIRGAEILANVHRDYGPMPIQFYKQLVKATGLTPVFMGQIAQDEYSLELRRGFPGAQFMHSQGAMQDFEIIRSAKNIVVSVSTFSWLAAWLSNAQTIHFPVRGIFNPLQRPDIDLLPLTDVRYTFYDFPTMEGAVNETINAVSGSETLDFPVVSINELMRRQSIALGRIRDRVAQYRSRLMLKALLHRIFGFTTEMMLALPK